MKKIATLSSVLLISIAANAQGDFESFRDREFNFDFLHLTGILIGIFLFTSFFLSVIRLFLESRLKRRMIDKGVSETVVEQFLQPTNRDSKAAAMKWFLILACIGLALMLIDMTLPIGIHSIAIMAFCIAFGFLCYYFFMKRQTKNNTNP